MGPRAFRIALIKPSHYDADGYVIQWRRSYIPSNSLASVYALIKHCAQTHTLGPDIEIEIEAFDECNNFVDVRAIAKRIHKAGAGMIGLVGVQSNQFPRALDLGREFRALGLPVIMGGFHVSGCLAMLPKIPPEIQEALDLGIHVFAGEAEGRMAEVLRDVAGGTAKPIYNYLDHMPELSSAVPPILPSNLVRLVLTEYSSFDAGRGCPFQCSFCTIINVQGRISRFRTAADVEAIVRANAAQGVTRFFVTDDNFARNRNWEAILDRLIELREREKFRIKLILQVDTLCHRIPNFIEKAARAGATFVFIGLENINPESLLGTKKRQNKIWEYREMLLAWRRHRVITYAGYILGFPTDTPESIARDIEIIKKELPIDILEFFCLTPLPGSEDHKKLHAAGVDLDPDLNKYDLEHACTDHPRMSRQKWTEVYEDAFARYYTDEHVEKIMRRAVAGRLQTSKLVTLLAIFSSCVRIEGVHPLQFGLVRRKSRTQRRYGMPLVHPLIFYPSRAYDFCKAHVQWGLIFWRYYRMMKRIKKDPAAKSYADEAMRLPSACDETDKIVELFADKIPHTYGAPVRPASGGATANLARVRAGGRAAADPALGAAQQASDIGAVHDPQ